MLSFKLRRQAKELLACIYEKRRSFIGAPIFFTDLTSDADHTYEDAVYNLKTIESHGEIPFPWHRCIIFQISAMAFSQGKIDLCAWLRNGDEVTAIEKNRGAAWDVNLRIEQGKWIDYCSTLDNSKCNEWERAIKNNFTDHVGPVLQYDEKRHRGLPEQVSKKALPHFLTRLLSALHPMMFPCGYVVRTEMKDGIGGLDMQRWTSGIPIVSFLRRDRVYSEWKGGNHGQESIEGHPRKQHWRYLWKEAGIDRSSLPMDPFERKLAAIRGKVRPILIHETWVGPRLWVDNEGNQHEIIAGESTIDDLVGLAKRTMRKKTA